MFRLRLSDLLSLLSPRGRGEQKPDTISRNVHETPPCDHVGGVYESLRVAATRRPEGIEVPLPRTHAASLRSVYLFQRPGGEIGPRIFQKGCQWPRRKDKIEPPWHINPR